MKEIRSMFYVNCEGRRGAFRAGPGFEDFERQHHELMFSLLHSDRSLTSSILYYNIIATQDILTLLCSRLYTDICTCAAPNNSRSFAVLIIDCTRISNSRNLLCFSQLNSSRNAIAVSDCYGESYSDKTPSVNRELLNGTFC